MAFDRYGNLLVPFRTWRNTKVLGIGDTSGMLPIDTESKKFDAEIIRKFDELTEPYGFRWELGDILPECMSAGGFAGNLTEDGVLFLDETGELVSGIPLCPPEGDAGNGGRGRSEQSERSPLRGKLLPLRSSAHKKRRGRPFLVDLL